MTAKTRRPRNKVYVTQTTPADKPAQEKKNLPKELANEYLTQGLSYSEARDLYRAKVMPNDIHKWTAAGVYFEDYQRMCYLSSHNIQPHDLQDYPHMPDQSLAALVNGNVTADMAHEFGHKLGLCCGHPYPVASSYGWAYRFWDNIPSWLKYDATPQLLAECLIYGANTAFKISEILVLRTSPKLLVSTEWKDIRSTWKEWVEAADGHVAVAKAVCDMGGDINMVKKWMETDEPIDRIVLLVRSNALPETVDNPRTRELTDEDLEVWVALTSPS